MAIIVSGASGNFGRQVTDILLTKVPASELILTSRRPENLAHLAAKGAQVRHADFDDPSTLPAAFAGGEKMLLISTARVGARVGQHQDAVDAAKAAGVTHVVYTSSAGLDPKSPALVVRDHRDTENLIKASGLNYTFLRDSQYAEAIAQAIAPLAVATGRWVSSAGQGHIAFVSRDDCVAVAAAVLTTPGHENKVYELTGPDRLTFPDAARLLSEVTGKPVQIVEVDDEGMFAHWDSLGVPRKPVDDQIVGGVPWNSDDMVTYEQALREGFFDTFTDNVEKITGKKPKSLRKVFEENLDAILAGPPGS